MPSAHSSRVLPAGYIVATNRMRECTVGVLVSTTRNWHRSDRFSWATRYAIRVSRKLEESFLSEEEDLVETLALIASTEFIQSVTQTLAHHDGQTSG